MKKIQSSDLSYPYDEKLSHKEYEETKALLQIELLKCQKWIKHQGERLVICLKGETQPEKAEPLSALWNISTLVALAWWH